MKSLFKNILLVSTPALVIVALLLELFFRVAIPASYPPQGRFDETHLIYKFDTAKSKGVNTIGALAQQRGQWRTNNHGWNSPIDYVEKKTKKRIAIIGDSFIEALQVDVDKSYPSLLRDSLGEDVDVYSFGVSGAPLSQYLHMSRYVRTTFDPDVFIFNVVHNDFYQSLYAHNPNDVYWLRLNIEDGKVEEVLPKADHSFVEHNQWKRLLRKSALVRYLYLNLNIKRTLRRRLSKKNPRYSANIDIDILEKNKKNVELATEYILGGISNENPDKRVIIVMDAPKDYIYENKDGGEVEFLHRIIDKYCSENGIEFLDLASHMRQSYEQNKRKFSSELDGHWDEYGHHFVYTKLAELL